MRALFIITSSKQYFWLSEVTHPYWHLNERGVEIDFASPEGGIVNYNPWSDPGSPDSWEPDDLVSKGFLSEPALVEKLRTTLRLSDVIPQEYAAVHVAGGAGAAADLYPNDDVRRILDHFLREKKPVGTICHGSISLGNNADLIRGRRVTGMTREEDAMLEKYFGPDFIPNWPQHVLENSGATFIHTDPFSVRVVVDGKLVTGQNNQSASEYSLQLHHAMVGSQVFHY
ncbi:type 1 glutamine amidotransferase domain-containing protein [Paraburkholderia caribensis]|uniref:type 1 glutamine amidotransferase domain-containing protein n=1 Tax=Paraburkholderia caribensis TaxID=75105 RepID=UPI00078E5768|nr:type 1 glutamine amidotransferase domain-containing protein [Paraburkholderia caribensis]AMV48275.1 hypothetical protein ATN79_47285 [Paraburkholderia caribensis]